MAYSKDYYQPSILELARQGNFRALAYWINSILGPQGIYVQTKISRSGRLQILVNFHQTSYAQDCISLRQQIVRFLCYRLWTLNSSAIREVQIMGRIAGNADILWEQAVRIRTPANQSARSRYASRREAQERFRLLRSFLLSRLAFAGFILCYWVLYLETAGYQTVEQPLDAAPATEAVRQPQVAPPIGAADQPKTTISRRDSQTVMTIPPEFQGEVTHDVQVTGNDKVVALTFDDGPWPQSTDKILSVLRQNNIKATFYWVGVALQSNPEIAKQVVAEGHAVGNHTWQHIMTDMDLATAAQELGNAARLIEEITGVRSLLMRPPGGNLSGELVNYAKQLKYNITLWSADSQDYFVSAPLIIDNVLRNVKPGGIILLHDGGGDRTATVEALPQIISALKSQGYRFVTVPELLAMPGKAAREARSH